MTVIWTAETRRVLMFAQPPTQICLQSRAKAAQSKEGEKKNIQGKCLPRVMIPACLAALKLRKTHSYEFYKYVFLGGHKRVKQIYTRTLKQQFKTSEPLLT